MSLIAAIIDPIIGNDATAKPITNEQPIFAYKTLDKFYTQFEGKILTAQVRQDLVEMNLLEYKSLTVTCQETNAQLNVNTKIGQSIVLENVTLRITTNVILPADPVDSTEEEDVPAIITKSTFYMEQYPLNISNDPLSPTSTIDKTRHIFDHQNIYFVENNGGIIDLPNRDVMVHVGGTVGYASMFEVIRCSGDFKLVAVLEENPVVALELDHSLVNVTSWEIHSLPSNTIHSLQDPLCPKGSAKVFIGKPGDKDYTVEIVSDMNIDKVADDLNSRGIKNFYFEYCECITSPGPSGPTGTAGLPRKSSPSRNKKKLFDKISKVKSVHPRVNAYIQSKLNKLQTESVTVRVSGGQLVNNNKDTIEAYVSNVKNSVDVNSKTLIGGEIFAPESQNEITPDEPNYNVVYDNDSYFNSGSIFREIQLILMDYTHTRFDGNIFVIDASKGDIVVNVPTDTLENRVFYYKRIDDTLNKVTITTPGGIDKCKSIKLKNSKCGYAKIRLFGYKGKLWVL